MEELLKYFIILEIITYYHKTSKMQNNAMSGKQGA